jgi:hypothetical protein
MVHVFKFLCPCLYLAFSLICVGVDMTGEQLKSAQFDLVGNEMELHNDGWISYLEFS